MHFDLSLGIDLTVIAAYFVAIVWVGLRYSKQENDLESFALGNRSLPWWAVLSSIIAAETSAATFLGTPGEGFKLVNYLYLQLVLGTIIGRVIVAYLFIKPFYDGHVFSIYELLETRFGRSTRMVASSVFLLTRLLASGARLYVAAIVLAVAFTLLAGYQPNAAQQLAIYITSIVAITILTAVYTSIGGIKAVIWTDCIQASVMFGGACGAIAVLLSLLSQAPDGLQLAQTTVANGLASSLESGIKPGAGITANLLNIFSQDYTLWSALLGMTFTTMATHGTDQDMVQRMLTAPDYKKSRLSLVLSGLADLPIGFIFLSIGVLLHVYYQQHSDPSLPQKTNEVFAYFILVKIPPGLRGLLIAGIFATAMGSLSAALNALATSFTRDFNQTANQSGKESVRLVKRSTYLFALLIIVVASATAYFVIAHPDSRIIPIVLSIFGYTYGSLLGVFLLALLTRTRGSDRGNIVAMTAGFLVVACISGLPGQLVESINLPEPGWLSCLPTVSFPWRIMVGSLSTFAVGCLFSARHCDEISTK
ncbi:MAG TPA: sodium:solute symporter [Planktothrix sp.]|jgi:SSS family transporter